MAAGTVAARRCGRRRGRLLMFNSCSSRRPRAHHAMLNRSRECGLQTAHRCRMRRAHLVRIGDRQRAGLADADERRAARRAAAILACAGCAPANARRRRAQHDAVEERQLQRAPQRIGRGPGPVTTISAARRRRSSALSSAAWLNRFSRGAPPARRRTAGRPARAICRRR